MLERFTEDLNIIQKLGDNPNTDDFLSAEQLKEKFDQAGNLIKDYLNGQVVPQVNNALNNKGTFIAEYGVTTKAEIREAFNADMCVAAEKNGIRLPLIASKVYGFMFSGYDGDRHITYRVRDEGWEEEITPRSQVFYAEYGVTTREEIIEKIDADFACYCRRNSRIFSLCSDNGQPGGFYFAGVDGDTSYRWYVSDSNEWTEQIFEVPPIMVVNHTFAPGGGTADKTHEEIYAAYTTGEVVLLYTGGNIYLASNTGPGSTVYFQTPLTAAGKLFQYSVDSSDTWSRSETTNYGHVTVINENSTDTNVPTAKAVYDFVMAQLEAMPNAAEVGY